jgi:nucleoid-associated protein YgaU
MLTPPIVASAIFTAACAVFAIAFVGARGGLQLPVAATDPPVAIASEAPSQGPTAAPSPPPTAPPTAPPPSPPTAAPTTAPTPPPTAAPTPEPTFVVPTLEPGDPLLALDGCPDRPGCFEYVVVRGDTLSGIISRYLLDFDVLEALNPGQLSDPNLIVVGRVLYVGRDPLARLEPCPGGEACAIYVVQAGESLAEIAERYLMTREAILAANPGLATPIQPGQVVKLPRLPLPS